MIVKRTCKWLIGLVFIIAALALLAINALFIWVATGPRSLDALTPYIESALAPPGSHYHVKVESSELIWEGWHHPVGIHIKNVKVMNELGAVVANFPEIGIRMYFFQLLLGRVDVKSVEVFNPAVMLIQGEDGSVSFGFNPDTGSQGQSLADALTLFISEDSIMPAARLQSFIIRHANLSIQKSGTVFLQSTDASLELTRHFGGKIKGALTIPLTFDGHKSELNAELGLSAKDKTINAEVVYTDIPSAVLHALFPAQEWMNAARMPLTGWANAVSDFNLHVSSLNFMLEAGPGIVDYPTAFEKPLPVQRIHVEGGVSDNFTALSIKQGALDFKTFTLSFNGSGRKNGDDYALDGTAEVNNVPGDDIHLYWPRTLAPNTRHWVTTHISRGMMTKGSVSAHFKPGEMKLKDTPEQAIDATINVKGVSLKYLPKHPTINDINGVIHFSGKAMDARMTGAAFLSATRASEGKVTIPDLNAGEVRMYVDVLLDTPARDVREFLSLPLIEKAKMLNLTSDLSGEASGEAKIDFVAFSDKDNGDDASTMGDVNYSVAAQLKNVGQHAFMRERDISGANMKLSLDNKGLKVGGTAHINDVPMNVDLTTNFGRGHETTYTVKTPQLPMVALPRFGLPALDFAKGSMGVNATFYATDKLDKATATLDLTSASIDLPEHGFSKKSGTAATLKLTTEQRDPGITKIPSFALRGDGMDISGSAQYDSSLHDFSRFDFDRVRFHNQDLDTVHYLKAADNSIRLNARGKVFDAAPYLQKSKEGATPAKHTYDIDVQADRLVLGEKRELTRATIKADCGERCHAVSIHGILPDGTPLSYSIGNGKLDASCANAGELLRVLGFFDGIQGGNLTMKGDYMNDILAGHMEITEYVLKRAPVLTKIFTIASLTGILDTLSGNGISFTRLSADFMMQGDVLTIKEAKAHGPAIGITTDGTINTASDMMALQGTLVPSYTLNSLVGNVPLIGNLLIGGKGTGIIALNYSARGKMENPSVRVNPLSALTPGFLRNIFTMFDKPTPDFDKIRAQAKEEKEKASPQEEVPQTPQPQAPESKMEEPKTEEPTAEAPKAQAQPETAAPSIATERTPVNAQ